MAALCILWMSTIIWALMVYYESVQDHKAIPD